MDTTKRFFIKYAVRKRCEWCNKNFPIESLEIHHINSNKHDDRESNIIVLDANHHRSTLRHITKDKRITQKQLRSKVKTRPNYLRKGIRDILRYGYPKLYEDIV